VRKRVGLWLGPAVPDQSQVLKGMNPYSSGYHRTKSGKEMRVANITYVSRVRVEPVKGRIRRAYLPVQGEPILFGVHSEVAEHYGASPEEVEPHDTTLDYLVAATGG
jgi:hypothetical protein